MENLSSAAAQGEQAFDPHHANGYNFTGADPNVRTLEDAVRHGSVHGHHPAHAGQHQFGASPASSSLQQHVPCAETPPHQPQWSHLTGVCPTDQFLRGAYVPYQPETQHGAGAYAHPHSAPTPIPYFGGGAASWYPPSSTTHSSANTPPPPWNQP